MRQVDPLHRVLGGDTLGVQGRDDLPQLPVESLNVVDELPVTEVRAVTGKDEIEVELLQAVPGSPATR